MIGLLPKIPGLWLIGKWVSNDHACHWKRPWCWEWLKAGVEGDDREWDGWMALPSQFSSVQKLSHVRLCNPLDCRLPAHHQLPALIQTHVHGVDDVTWPRHFMANRWGINGNSDRLYFLGYQSHWLNGHEFEQAPGVGDGQGSLACCSPWSSIESDMIVWLNWLTERVPLLSRRDNLGGCNIETSIS